MQPTTWSAARERLTSSIRLGDLPGFKLVHPRTNARRCFQLRWSRSQNGQLTLCSFHRCSMLPLPCQPMSQPGVLQSRHARKLQVPGSEVPQLPAPSIERESLRIIGFLVAITDPPQRELPTLRALLSNAMTVNGKPSRPERAFFVFQVSQARTCFCRAPQAACTRPEDQSCRGIFHPRSGTAGTVP